ncbi:pilus assembly protein [Vibrio sp. SCSIO 43140]|uniref:TadE family protein n=1 Tax=Vibrio sp. SCSIO 43140 TaxID=2819100 RepID=UPI0020753C38|nr:TadE family protein [Vibrio sp. SCSIO 43140]USD61776.1 pilus assembly protein [Vibrio sp. SCSIO 43140]
MKMAISSQRGLTIIEFTLIAWGLMVLMMFAFEIGRYMFSMQMLNEMTRKAARLGVVCSIEDRLDIRDLSEVAENRPIEFESQHLVLSYLDSSGNEVSVTGYEGMDDDSKTSIFGQIRYVKAEIDGYRFRFMPLLSFIGDSGLLDVPAFTTVLPVESLGVVRPNSGSEDGANENC